MYKSLFFGVRSGQTYECKVDGVCEDGTISSTLVHTVTLPSVDTSRQRNCGVLPPVDLSVTEPLEGLLPGDFFLGRRLSGPGHFQHRRGWNIQRRGECGGSLFVFSAFCCSFQ